MADKEKYIIKIQGKLIEVSEDVYYAYFRMERQERWQEEKKQEHDVVSYDALDNGETVGAEQKERLQHQEDDGIIEATEQLLEAINAGPAMLESFDEELFCELIDKVIVESNTKIRFRLKNGLELPETIERTVR